MGGQYHHELMKYCPPSYVLCVSSHFWPFNIVKFVLEKLDKNLGSADPPPPSVGPKSQIFPKIRFEGSPKILSHEWKPGSMALWKTCVGRLRNQDWYNWFMLQTNQSLTQQLNKNLYNLVRRVKEDSYSSRVEDAVVHVHSLLSRQMWPHVKKYQLVEKWETKRFVPQFDTFLTNLWDSTFYKS